MRINQYVAASSGLSRRAADIAIADGHVIINGAPATIGQAVPPGADVSLDGRRLQPPTHHTYLMLHKPSGYVTSRARQGSDPTIYDLLPTKYHSLRPAGRLDRDSSGLLLLSDDGSFIQRHTHPSYEHGKLYELELDRPVTPAAVHQLERGVKLKDGPSQLQIVSHHGLRLIALLHEGRNRQVRRTLGAVGYSVKRLHRLQVGEYQLGDLPSGNWQILPATEPA
ncbi:MAG TPA: pseudouridine synthase [Candidatus Saccharimonas sp.]|nr:pseudouridine synthase [Candidatus Saccharimonas sp.]